MSYDILEIALEYYTDDKQFELLAAEIMRMEGFINIKPLGGSHDKGRDAIELYINDPGGKLKSVFQFTIQKTGITSKIMETIKKLQTNKVEFSEFVFVTPHSITTDRQDKLMRSVRTTYGVVMNIFERKTIINRLANKSNGIFNRYFPDIDRQIENLKPLRPILLRDDAEEHEQAALKAALSFSMGRDSQTARVSIMEHLCLAIIMSKDNHKIALTDLISECDSIIRNKSLAENQTNDFVKKLSEKKYIIQENGNINALPLAIEKCGAFSAKADEATNTLIQDIVDTVCDTHTDPIDSNIKSIMERNALNVLVDYFQLFGIEISNQFIEGATPSPVYHDASEKLIQRATSLLPKQLGQTLVSTIAEFISDPPPDHIKTLANWSLAYLGINIMNIDPILREIEKARMAKKIFILDTDFVINCLVRECPISSTYLKIIADIIRQGCRVIIPEAVVEECLLHASNSPKTYNYFGVAIFNHCETVVKEMIWNAFVKGYYYAYRDVKNTERLTYDEYLSNYYDLNHPRKYFAEVIRGIMPKGIEILNPTALLSTPIPDEQMSKMTSALLESLRLSKKAIYRSEEENINLAETDSRLFLTALYLNAESGKVENNILGGTCYLITSSAKYINNARKVGIPDVVTTRPQSIASLLEIIGEGTISDIELIQLFENPFLIYAVGQSIESIKRLVDSGLDLKDKSIIRLRYDLDQYLHDRITIVSQESIRVGTSQKTVKEELETDKLIDFLNTARANGYKASPEVENLLDYIKELKNELTLKTDENMMLENKFAIIESMFSEFGRRKQKYLRKQLTYRKKK